MKKITEKELKDMGRAPRKTRINMRTGQKQVHLYTDDEILAYVKTGVVNIGPDAEWIEVVKE